MIIEIISLIKTNNKDKLGPSKLLTKVKFVVEYNLTKRFLQKTIGVSAPFPRKNEPPNKIKSKNKYYIAEH